MLQVVCVSCAAECQCVCSKLGWRRTPATRASAQAEGSDNSGAAAAHPRNQPSACFACVPTAQRLSAQSATRRARGSVARSRSRRVNAPAALHRVARAPRERANVGERVRRWLTTDARHLDLPDEVVLRLRPRLGQARQLRQRRHALQRRRTRQRWLCSRLRRLPRCHHRRRRRRRLQRDSGVPSCRRRLLKPLALPHQAECDVLRARVSRGLREPPSEAARLPQRVLYGVLPQVDVRPQRDTRRRVQPLVLRLVLGLGDADCGQPLASTQGMRRDRGRFLRHATRLRHRRRRRGRNRRCDRRGRGRGRARAAGPCRGRSSKALLVRSPTSLFHTHRKVLLKLSQRCYVVCNCTYGSYRITRAARTSRTEQYGERHRGYLPSPRSDTRGPR